MTIVHHPAATALVIDCLKTGLDPYEIQYMGRDELLRIQKLLGYGDLWGQWNIPPEWLGAGNANPSRHITQFPAEANDFDRAWTEILRVALLLSLTNSMRRGRPQMPSTIHGHLKAAVRMAPMLSKAGGSEDRWWSRISAKTVCEAIGRAETFICALRTLHLRGYIPDCPSGPQRDDSAGERDRHGEPAPEQKVDDSKTFQPFPDEFVGQCGFRALWFMTNAGPGVLDCFEACLAAIAGPTRPFKRRSGRNPMSEAARLSKARSQIVKGWQWLDPSGQRLDAVPFKLNMRSRRGGGAYADFAWPPQDWVDLCSLLSVLQICHAWLLLLSSGPRASTILSYTEDCVVSVDGGFRLQATLYKTTDELGGRQRDWPAPAKVVYAANQQIRLARLMKRFSNPDDPAAMGNHIFVAMPYVNAKSPGNPLQKLNHGLLRMVQVFDMQRLLGPDNPYPATHRFRKTTARLIALSLTNAQMILMDCFGHEDPEMTLGYMTSDRAIIGDALRVQRELVVLMAKDAIMSADDLGGAVAEKIREAKAEYLRVHQKSKLDPADDFELAETLTLGGRDWALVMPGVICTLPTGFTGPCAVHQGGRNPGNCQAGCGHQLLLNRFKTECDDNVRYVVEQLLRAEESGSVTLPMWQGQLATWLYRWTDVYDAWSNHPIVQKYGDPSMTREWIAE